MPDAAAEARADAAATQDPAAAPEAAAAQDPAVDAPAPPPAAESVEYALALPENSTLDPAAVERLTALAKANGLSPEAAQSVLAMMDGETGNAVKVLDAANKPGGALYKSRVETWGKEALSAFDLGNGSKERLDAVLVEAQAELAKAPPAIRDFLEQSGYGSHPDAIRWLRDIHQRTKERPAVMGDKGAPPPKPRSIQERMYGSGTPAEATT